MPMFLSLPVRAISCGFATTFTVLATGAMAQETVPGDWQFGAEIYLWGASLGTETTSGSEVDIEFGTLIQDLNMGFMGSFAAQKDRWTLFADAIYLNVNDKQGGSVDVLGFNVDTDVEVSLAGFISTFGAAYRVNETQAGSVDVLGGVRYLWLDSDLNYDLGSERGGTSGSDDSWDAVVGLRGQINLNENWYLDLYGDVGAGQSDLTWQALAAVNYRLAKADLTFGYRYLEWQFDDFGPFERLDVSGPYAGVKFRF